MKYLIQDEMMSTSSENKKGRVYNVSVIKTSQVKDTLIPLGRNTNKMENNTR